MSSIDFGANWCWSYCRKFVVACPTCRDVAPAVCLSVDSLTERMGRCLGYADHWSFDLFAKTIFHGVLQLDVVAVFRGEKCNEF